MKTAPKLSSLVSTKTVLASSLLAASLLVTGCQTTSLSQSSTSAASQSPADAKKIVVSALQQQRRQSFSYHTNLEISNDKQFTNVDTKQLVASASVDSYCEDNHDQGYAALLTQSEAQGKDISASAYQAQRNALKLSYVACAQAYEAWSDSHYDSDADAVAADDANYDVKRTNKNAVIVVPSSSPTADKQANLKPVSPYYDKIFTEYEGKKTKLDIKKAQLMDAYLLKPLSLNAQGVYQPLAGKFTMLTSAQYQARNNYTSINQPIYVDLKNGTIYLWADNFASMNSKVLDDKLGAKWHNKWLKIALDDGTLPKGFGSAVIKSHFAALDALYEQAAVSRFDVIAPDTLTTLFPKIPQQQLAPMLHTPKIIRRVQDAASYEQSYKTYINTFHKLIGQQYPDLIVKKTSDEDDAQRPGAEKFTSKILVQHVLIMMKSAMDSDPKTSTLTPTEQVNTRAPIQELYGFDKRGQLQWQHTRSDLPTSKSRQAQPSDSVTIDVLQQYLPLRTQDAAFLNLPSDRQVPNASNSIDLRDYSKELAAYYKAGHGTAMGKLLLNMLPIYKSMYATQVEMMNAE
ncbi:hypothetical protein [Psychrobacter urativorans]|uniref:Lipoprotein n=1 Tax=Psychrobacter urativorans TaxID=45610 RepID=A0A0M4T626_9GAMM|nr:hypothetical protein [Psychrobacter urativorans]ALF58784.1 hypothetical protein AOC03_00895 [Psychrobacter urativorans]